MNIYFEALKNLSVSMNKLFLFVSSNMATNPSTSSPKSVWCYERNVTAEEEPV